MDDQVLQSVSLYLDGGIDFDALEDRIIPIAFRADPQKGGLVYQLVAEIAYVKDSVSDEPTFKSRVEKIVSRHEIATAQSAAV